MLSAMATHAILGERFARRNGPAWALGPTVQDVTGKRMTATEAVVHAGADYTVVARPTYYPTLDESGTMAPTGQFALVRPSQGENPEQAVSSVSKHYTPLQNLDVARLLDPLTAQWPVATVGTFGSKGRMFIALESGETTIGGDPVSQYLFAINGHDAGTAFRVMLTPVRVWCWNMLQTGLHKASFLAHVRHHTRVAQEAELAINLTAQIRQAADLTLQEIEKLTRITLAHDHAILLNLLHQIYPDPSPSQTLAHLMAHESGQVRLTADRMSALQDMQADYETARERQAGLRKVAFERILAFYEDRPAYAWTAWAAWNGITETETWREGGSSANITASILTGARRRTMATAFRLLLQPQHLAAR
jgi:uncharacterized protein DUF932